MLQRLVKCIDALLVGRPVFLEGVGRGIDKVVGQQGFSAFNILLALEEKFVKHAHDLKLCWVGGCHCELDFGDNDGSDYGVLVFWGGG